jgi:hypothetical protein
MSVPFVFDERIGTLAGRTSRRLTSFTAGFRLIAFFPEEDAHLLWIRGDALKD